MRVTVSCPSCGDCTVSVEVDVDADQRDDGTWRPIYTAGDPSPCAACGYAPIGAELANVRDEAEEAAHDQARAESGR